MVVDIICESLSMAICVSTPVSDSLVVDQVYQSYMQIVRVPPIFALVTFSRREI